MTRATRCRTRGGQLCCYGPALPAGVFDQTEIEQRHDVLLYRSAPLEQDVEVTGPIGLELWASTTAPDTDFTAKLVDICPGCGSRNLTDGIIRTRYRSGTEQAIPITPNQPYPYWIDLWSTSNVFRGAIRSAWRSRAAIFHASTAIRTPERAWARMPSFGRHSKHSSTTPSTLRAWCCR